jgi:hypothetical protein
LTEAFKIFRRNAKFNEGFNLQHCWTVLRDKHKWKTIVAKKQAREAKNAMMAGHATPMPTSYRLPQGQQHHLPQYTPQTQQPTQPIQTQVHHSADPPQLQTEPSTQPQVLTQPMQPQIQPIDQSANSCNIVLAPQKKRKPSTHDAEYNTSKLRLKERKLDIKIMAFDPMQFVDPIRREFFKIQQKEVLCRWRRIIQDDNQQGDEEVATS